MDNEHDEHDDVALEGSIWSAPLLIGSRAGCAAGSVLLCGLMLLNVFVQGSFVKIAMSHLSNPSIVDDTVAELQTWRRVVAHDVDYNECVCFTSPLPRACAAAMQG